MAAYSAVVQWQRGEQAFTDGKYSREHRWEFDGGAVVAASASPHIVPLPFSVAENVDPEEAFVAAASSCHMLFYLHLAQQAGFIVDAYRDDAEGIMERNDQDRMAITRITLRPTVRYAGAAPSREDETALHHRAHEACFIANSVTATIETILPS